MPTDVSDSRTSVKINIPHPAENNGAIVGILEQLTTQSSAQGSKLALILHGTMGHKDYLFQKQIARNLSIDSFRFDFRGNHESSGDWNYAALEKDVIDISVVADYLKQTYGYIIDLLVGHSRGSLAAMRWICTTEHGNRISGFVNISARYRMKKSLEAPVNKDRIKSFSEKGYHEWTVSVSGKSTTVRILPEDLDKFCRWDTSLVWKQFPQTIHVLVLHGLKDDAVPPYDAVIYTQAFDNRSPGTIVLNFIEEADHNYTGRKDEVVDTIINWWAVHKKGELKSGVWSCASKSSGNSRL